MFLLPCPDNPVHELLFPKIPQTQQTLQSQQTGFRQQDCGQA